MLLVIRLDYMYNRQANITRVTWQFENIKTWNTLLSFKHGTLYLVLKIHYYYCCIVAGFVSVEIKYSYYILDSWVYSVYTPVKSKE